MTASDIAQSGSTQLVTGLVKSARPRQWVKNVLVFAAPGAAGVLDQATSMGRAVLAFAAFSLVASGLYFVNDIVDREADRAHPVKRFRPIANGQVPLGVAVTSAGVLIATGLVLGAATSELKLVWTLLAYVAITVTYSTHLKHWPVIDLAAVASGFVLRSVGGAFAVDVPISNWFLIVALFGSLFMVTGKRRAEQRELGDRRGDHRPSLDEYPERFLDLLLATTLGIVVLAYCLWAFETADGQSAERAVSLAEQGSDWFVISVVPFSLAVIRYAFDVETGLASAPEDIVLKDRQIQVLGAVWAATFALGLYA